jgi:hypothetical protein
VQTTSTTDLIGGHFCRSSAGPKCSRVCLRIRRLGVRIPSGARKTPGQRLSIFVLIFQQSSDAQLHSAFASPRWAEPPKRVASTNALSCPWRRPRCAAASGRDRLVGQKPVRRLGSLRGAEPTSAGDRPCVTRGRDTPFRRHSPDRGSARCRLGPRACRRGCPTHEATEAQCRCRLVAQGPLRRGCDFTLMPRAGHFHSCR